MSQSNYMVFQLADVATPRQLFASMVDYEIRENSGGMVDLDVSLSYRLRCPSSDRI
jgi:hypothetical protein